MRAARLHAWGTDPVVENVREPAAHEGESLVAVAAAAVAHIDLTVASGNFPQRPELPYIPGIEGAGRVVRSARFTEGTPVRVRGAGVGLTRDGACAELAAFPDDALVELPPGTDLEVAATFFSPCLTAHAALHEVGALAAGERVAITGAGGAVGSVAVQLALRADAEVVGIVRNERKARALPPGAHVVLIADIEQLAGVDLLVDTVGGGLLPRLVTRAVRPGGRAVLVGYSAGEDVSFHLPTLMAADVRLLPMNLIRWGDRLEPLSHELLAAIQRGELELPRTTLPLERIGDALEHVRSGTAVGRVAVTMDVTQPGGG
jgi:NADPH:quinone reductase-like Zn-dependent oxidoreductase